MKLDSSISYHDNNKAVMVYDCTIYDKIDLPLKEDFSIVKSKQVRSFYLVHKDVAPPPGIAVDFHNGTYEAQLNLTLQSMSELNNKQAYHKGQTKLTNDICFCVSPHRGHNNNEFD